MSALSWQALVTDKLYHCTDSLGFDFLRPGQWVHGVGVPGGDTMSGQWTVSGLWYLWCSLMLGSLIISGLVALAPRDSRKKVGVPVF